MKLLEILTIFLYGGALIFVIYVIFSLIHKPSAQTIIVYDQPPVYKNTVLNPFAGAYNYWPQWTGWYNGGGDGGYGGGYHGRRWGSGASRPYGGFGRGANPGMRRGGMGGGRVGGGGMGGFGGRSGGGGRR